MVETPITIASMARRIEARDVDRQVVVEEVRKETLGASPIRGPVFREIHPAC
jgi:hypothetical protein